MTFVRRRFVALVPLAFLVVSCGTVGESAPGPTRTVFVTPSPSTVYIPGVPTPDIPSFGEQRQAEREAEQAVEEAAADAKADAAALADRCQQSAEFAHESAFDAYDMGNDTEGFFYDMAVEDRERRAQQAADFAFDSCMFAG